MSAVTGNAGGAAVSALLDAATARYRAAGHFAWRFARGKLRGDPAFVDLLARGLIPSGARLLDLGCGQGLLAAWLLAARTLDDARRWPGDWPPPPRLETISGIELMPTDVLRARTALGHHADIVAGDIRTADFGLADVVVILDVLHYLDFAAQEAVLVRVRGALVPGGTLLLRVGDAAAGWGYRWSRWVDSTVMFLRGHGRVRLHCRTLAAWRNLLAADGFAVESWPMHAGTAFANVLLVARL